MQQGLRVYHGRCWKVDHLCPWLAIRAAEGSSGCLVPGNVQMKASDLLTEPWQEGSLH